MLIEHLGGRLAGSVKGVGRAFRMGGDEFCVLVPAERATAALVRAGEALREEGEGFRIDASVGVVDLPGDVADAEAALQLADRRMYAQKEGRPHSPARQSGDVLLRVIGEREPELLAHTRAVAELSRALASAMGLDAEMRETVARAAELHDVGKVAVPDAILSKPGPLDPDEEAFMRRHTVIGESIIAEAPALREVAALVRASHERWDGTGYPDNLAGHEIPLGARIVSVCDAYSAMRQRRPYGAVLDEEEALDELRRGAGSQFDPALVAAFCVLRGSSGGSGRFIRAAAPAALRPSRSRRPAPPRSKPPDRSRPPRRRPRSPRSARRSGAGSSHIGVWPSPGSTSKRTPGMSRRKRPEWRSIGSSRSLSPQATRVGACTRSRSTTRAVPLRIVLKTSSTTAQRIEERVSSTASSAGTRCPRAMMSRIPILRKPGRASSFSWCLTVARAEVCVRLKSRMIRSTSLRSCSSQPPPGESATTLRARPRLASSSASAPPIELPARCAVPTPSPSSSDSKWSTACASVSAPGGEGGPPSWPCSVGAITSNRGTSRPSTGSQQRHVAVKPWIRTSGSPVPARYRAGESSGMRDPKRPPPPSSG